MSKKDIFSDVIGYESIKAELKQIADVLSDPTPYDKIGIKPPRGLLLDGAPGVGKTLLASCLIKASARKCYTLRKNAAGGEFVKNIKGVFKEAAANAPSIVFLDDMDKFANGNPRFPDADEYVTIQSCMDSIKNKQVFVLATTNSIRALPRSLIRSGRFDRRISVKNPKGKDAEQIIKHYLEDKNVDPSIDIEFITRMLDGKSCAELESMLNEAGIYAGYERSETIKMEHLTKAFLREAYKVDSIYDNNPEYDLEDESSMMPEVIYHEAGHTVIAEILNPGSVTYTSVLGGQGNIGGVTCTYNDKRVQDIKWKLGKIIEGLGGMAATEQKFGAADSGSSSDLNIAYKRVFDLIGVEGLCGFPFHNFDDDATEAMKNRIENQTCNEMERIYKKAKEIISKNMDFFEKIAEALAKKHFITNKDILEIRNTCNIATVEIM